MKELFYLFHEQISRIKRYFPRSYGILRVDDRRIVSGIIYAIKHDLQWKNALRSLTKQTDKNLKTEKPARSSLNYYSRYSLSIPVRQCGISLENHRNRNAGRACLSRVS